MVSAAKTWTITKGFGWTTDRKTYGPIWNILKNGVLVKSVDTRNWAKYEVAFQEEWDRLEALEAKQ